MIQKSSFPQKCSECTFQKPVSKKRRTGLQPLLSVYSDFSSDILKEYAKKKARTLEFNIEGRILNFCALTVTERESWPCMPCVTGNTAFSADRSAAELVLSQKICK